MSSNMKIGLLAALGLALCGATSAAMAGDRDADLSASAAQVEREGLQQNRPLQNHIGNGGTVYDYIGSPDRTQSRKSR